MHRFLRLAGTAPLATLLALSTGCHDGLPRDHRLRTTDSIRGIFEDRGGPLWVWSPEWLCRYDPDAPASAASHFTYFPALRIGSMTAAVQQDSQGRILVQDRTGILINREGRFERLADREYDDASTWDAQPGDLWFGADAGVELSAKERSWGVYRYRDGRCTFLRFPGEDGREPHGFHPLTAPVMRGGDGTLWFGTFEAAFGFDGDSFDVLDRERMGRAEDPLHIGLRGYHLDSRGLLWMADNGAGVYVYDGSEVIHFTALHDLSDTDTDGPSLHRSFSIGESPDGTMWFGTAYSGVWRFQPSPDDPVRSGSFTNFGAGEGMPCENVWTIYRTRSGALLFAGERPGGIYRFDGAAFQRVL